MVLADEDSPAFLLGGFQGAMAFFRDEPKITDVFRTGKGVDWVITITTCMKLPREFLNRIILRIL